MVVRMARAFSALARLLPAVALVAVGTVLPAYADAQTTPTTPATLAPGTTITITGHGYGHGHGMSQYGARGAASQGLSYRQILAFFYPHTSVSQVTARISVLITKDTTRDVVVQARSGLIAQRPSGGRIWTLSKLQPKATRWRIIPVGNGGSELDFYVHQWRRQTHVAGGLQFSAGSQPIRLYIPHGSVQYHGILRSVQPTSGTMDRDTVNVLGLEQYVRGVVPTEMPPSWSPAAVRAQAVAARTYAIYEKAANPGRYYDVCDTSVCQNYGGYSAQVVASNQATTATAGQILTYGGKPAFAQFAASDGGWSRDGGEPYLVGQQDVYEKYADDPYRTWTAKVTIKQIETRWPSAGPIVSVRLTHDASKQWVDRVTIRGTKATYTVTGDQFSSWAGLRSANFGIKIG